MDMLVPNIVSFHWWKRHAKRLQGRCTSHQLPCSPVLELLCRAPLLAPLPNSRRYVIFQNISVLEYINHVCVLDRLEATRRNPATTERYCCWYAQPCNSTCPRTNDVIFGLRATSQRATGNKLVWLLDAFKDMAVGNTAYYSVISRSMCLLTLALRRPNYESKRSTIH